jgi:hypothetical protein
LQQLKAGALKGSKEIDDFRKQLEAKVAADLAKKDATLGSLQGQLREQLVESAAQKAIAEAGGSLKLLLPVVRSAVKAEVAADGRLSVVLVDETGKEMVSKVAGATGPMSISEFVSTLRESSDYKAAFAGSGTGGSGATHSTAGAVRAANPGSTSARELFNRANATV